MRRCVPFGRVCACGGGAERADVTDWFSKLSVQPGGALEMELIRFSGGNQQKIHFAKRMRRQPAVFLGRRAQYMAPLTALDLNDPA